MRIGIVTETYPPEINGVALTVQGLAEGLAARGHQVEVVRPRQRVESPDDRIVSVLVRGAALPRYPGLRFGLPAGSRLLRRWRAERPDAVYIATEGPLGNSALNAAHRLGIPVASGFHTRFDDYAAHYGLGFLTPLVLAHLRRFHRRSAATLVPTQALHDELLTLGVTNAHLLRRAVDTALFQPSRRDPALRAAWRAHADAPVVLYVGRIAAEKNLDLAIAAFRALQSRVPGTRYVWVGDGPLRAELAAAHPDFVFAGVQRGEALARHYASADLFLFPSLSETFGNVTLEAMASGVAVVAFDHGAAREHIIDDVNGRRIDASDRDGFVAAALDLALDAPRRERLGHNARASVAALAPEAVIAEFETLLRTLAEEALHGPVAAAGA